ncbi:MAG: sulfotransferase family 2 domain-containing protein [Pseudomonadota bacterium]
MIYSAKHNYLFVHIPKTGGTSMALALERRAARDDIMLGDTPKARKRRERVKDAVSAGRLWKHSSLRDLDGLLTPAQISNARVFTMVRNPWDRMVSYYHWLRAQDFSHEAVRIAKAAEFSQFLNHAHTQATFRANPYASYVTDRDGRECCDLFVRLEHLTEDLPKLEALIGLKLGVLPHENASNRAKRFQTYYTHADRNLLAELCAADIERFRYVFE